MAKARDTIFVEDLPGDMPEQRIQEIFHAYGTVISVKASPPTPQGTRSAVIQMDNEEEASWFVDNVNGNKCQGLDNPVKISYHVEAPPPASKGLGKAGQGSTARTSPYGVAGTAAAPIPATVRASIATSPAGGGLRTGTSPAPALSAAGAAASPPSVGGGSSSSSCAVPFMGNPKAVTAAVPAAGAGGAVAPPATSRDNRTTKTGAKLLVDGIIDSGELPGGAMYANDENTLFIRGLPRDTTDLELYQIFAPFGAIAPRGCRAMRAEDKMTCKGTGFVNYMTSKAAQDAISALNGTTMPGDRKLTISIKQEFSAPPASVPPAVGTSTSYGGMGNRPVSSPAGSRPGAGKGAPVAGAGKGAPLAGARAALPAPPRSKTPLPMPLGLAPSGAALSAYPA